MHHSIRHRQIVIWFDNWYWERFSSDPVSECTTAFFDSSVKVEVIEMFDMDDTTVF